MGKKLIAIFSLILLFFVTGLLIKFSYDKVFILYQFYQEYYREEYQENNDYNEFISRVKNDLGITLPTKIIVTFSEPNFASLNIGEYSNFSHNNANCVKAKSYTIKVNTIYFVKMTEGEKKAVITHEIGHIIDMEKIPCPTNTLALNLNEKIKLEINADTIAAKYTNPKLIRSALEKAVSLSPKTINTEKSRELKERMENLDRLTGKQKSRTN